jgi:hypothetical protein
MQRKDSRRKIDSGRRAFIKDVGLGAIALPLSSYLDLTAGTVAVVVDPADVIAMSQPAQWAIGELVSALTKRGITVRQYNNPREVDASDLCIIIDGSGQQGNRNIPLVPEALGIFPGKSAAKQTTIAAARDPRGLVYALLELTDRVVYSNMPVIALQVNGPWIEKPANKVRSLNRLFVSETEDKPWYNDRDMWPQYLTMLATQRFNRFNLSMGIGYDFLQRVTDAYFLFPYPFLLAVPGYDVHVPELPDAERDSNLAMLKYISEQTVARGMEFRLGIWMHGYEWLNTTNANYTIKGLTNETQASYSRDALRVLLQQCPAISGITFRVHGESGVNEGSYDFWKTIFDGIKTCGRVVEIDMHSKGMDQQMIDTALSVGVPVSISPKWWAEHSGLPYHQTDIRALEIPRPTTQASALMNLSAGSRSFTRYGYGDLLREDRKYDVLHRIWPGTQRLLLSGDPFTSAAQSRIFSFCGSSGVELMEPLSFKGRRGSGVAGDRCGYADASLKPKWDWEKYLYTLRVFGRTMYNPETRPEVWNRYLRHEFGAAAADVREALANATRILPIVLTAHGTSAGNNTYWPEMYTNQPITGIRARHPYTDTPSPRVFGMVSPMDPQLFSSIHDHAAELLKGEVTGKYSPIEVAEWIIAYAAAAEKHLAKAGLKSSGKNKREYRRMVTDVKMQIGLGRFFADKFRAATLFALYEQSGDRVALQEALILYRRAREQWAFLANNVAHVYKQDVSAGETAHLRGHWRDRLPAIDEDIAEMSRLLDLVKPTTAPRPAMIAAAVHQCLQKPKRATITARHQPLQQFIKGADIALEIAFDKPPHAVILHYRHINHAERYQSVAMKRGNGSKYTATIPATYTQSPYPLAYYFELKETPQLAGLYPGLGAQLKDQPYFVMQQPNAEQSSAG